LVPVAVNVTPVPEQTEVGEDAILTVGVNVPVTVRLTKLEAAVVGVKQDGKVPPAATFEEITSPLVGA
jgi:hypothetical protein